MTPQMTHTMTIKMKTKSCKEQEEEGVMMRGNFPKITQTMCPRGSDDAEREGRARGET